MEARGRYIWSQILPVIITVLITTILGLAAVGATAVSRSEMNAALTKAQDERRSDADKLEKKLDAIQADIVALKVEVAKMNSRNSQ